MGLGNLVPRSLVDEAEGEDLAFGFVHKRSGNEIRGWGETCSKKQCFQGT